MQGAKTKIQNGFESGSTYVRTKCFGGKKEGK
jgi:hypothetical protein